MLVKLLEEGKFRKQINRSEREDQGTRVDAEVMQRQTDSWTQEDRREEETDRLLDSGGQTGGGDDL